MKLKIIGLTLLLLVVLLGVLSFYELSTHREDVNIQDIQTDESVLQGEIMTLRFVCSSSHDDPYYVPDFDFLPEDFEAIRSLFKDRAIEPHPMKWNVFGAIQFTTRDGLSDAVPLYMRRDFASGTEVVVYRRSGSKTYYTGCSVAELLYVLKKSKGRQEKRNDAPAK